MSPISCFRWKFRFLFLRNNHNDFELQKCFATLLFNINEMRLRSNTIILWFNAAVISAESSSESYKTSLLFLMWEKRTWMLSGLTVWFEFYIHCFGFKAWLVINIKWIWLFQFEKKTDNKFCQNLELFKTISADQMLINWKVSVLKKKKRDSKNDTPLSKSNASDALFWI